MRYIFIHLKKTGSTNEVVADLIERGTSLPIVVVAEEQMRGKGRFGREWYSPKGGLWFSIGDELPGDKKVFSLYLPLAVIETLEFVSGLTFTIRIPNDIVIKEKKISGVLVEEKRGKIISGIGININIKEFPQKLRKIATSLYLLNKKNYNLKEVLDVFMENYEKLKKCMRENERNLFQRWREKISTLGRDVKVVVKDEEIEGNLIDIDDSFQLKIKSGEKIYRFSIWDLLRIEEK